MNRILLASALVLGVSGAAFAQQAPYYAGNYDGAVLTQFNDALSGSNVAAAPAAGYETMTTASIDDMSSAAVNAQAVSSASGELNAYDAWQATAGR